MVMLFALYVSPLYALPLVMAGVLPLCILYDVFVAFLRDLFEFCFFSRVFSGIGVIFSRDFLEFTQIFGGRFSPERIEDFIVGELRFHLPKRISSTKDRFSCVSLRQTARVYGAGLSPLGS